MGVAILRLGTPAQKGLQPTAPPFVTKNFFANTDDSPSTFLGVLGSFFTKKPCERFDQIVGKKNENPYAPEFCVVLHLFSLLGWTS